MTPLEEALRAVVAVTVERVEGPPDLLVVRNQGEEMALSTVEAAALITALLADGRVHAAWLHGRGGE